MDEAGYYESPKIIAEVGKLLREPVPAAGEDLEVHLIELDALRYDLAEATVNQMKLLHDKRKTTLWPKDADKNLTELDRNTRLAADVSVIERDYRLLERIEAIVEGRMGLCMTLLRL